MKGLTEMLVKFEGEKGASHAFWGLVGKHSGIGNTKCEALRQ